MMLIYFKYLNIWMFKRRSLPKMETLSKTANASPEKEVEDTLRRIQLTLCARALLLLFMKS